MLEEPECPHVHNLPNLYDGILTLPNRHFLALDFILPSYLFFWKVDIMIMPN